MLRKIFLSVILVAGFISSFSQSVDAVKVDSPGLKKDSVEAKAPPEEIKPTTTINGAVDIYYRYNFANPKSAPYNDYTSFTSSQNRFEIGMATVRLEHKTAKFDVVADLGFGQRAKDFSYNEQGILAAIKQMYISYSPKTWLKLTAGTWATHVGYEMVDAFANRNYSISYMFTNGPFFHTGVRADATSGKSGFMVGVSNPTDFKYVPSGVLNKKFLIAQYSYAASDNLKLYLNYVGGQNIDTSKSSQFDLVLTSKFSSVFSLAFNGTLNNTKLWENGKSASAKSWWGSAVYLNYDPKPWFGLTLRTEYFSDKNQLKLYAGQPWGGTVFANTLSANFKVDGFIFIPEIRLDNASHEIFTDHDGAGTKGTVSLLFAAIYSF